MKKKIVSMVLACVMACTGILAGCSGGTSDTSKGETKEETADTSAEASSDASSDEVTTVEYAFWGDQNEINTIMATIDEFNKTHTDIQVKGIGMDSSVYLQKLSAYISSNTMPDIIQVAMDYGDAYTSKGVFAPLDELIDSNGLRDKVSDSLWEGLSYEGSTYAVPLTASALMLVGNKDLFAEAGIEFPTDGWTEEEFKEAAIAMTDAEKGQYGIILGGHVTGWPMALYGNGENEIYDRENGQMQATNNPAVEHAYDFMINDIMLENQAAPAVLSSKDIGGGFETGKYGMATIGFWNIKSYHETVQDSFEWDLLPLPTSEEYGQWKTDIYANALSISASSDKKEAAFEYLKWVLEDRTVQTTSVMLPVNTEIAEDPAYLEEFEEGSKVYNRELAFDALYNGRLWQNTGTIAEINENVINPEIEKLILQPDSTSLQEALENIQEEGQKLFDAAK